MKGPSLKTSDAEIIIPSFKTNGKIPLLIPSDLIKNSNIPYQIYNKEKKDNFYSNINC